MKLHHSLLKPTVISIDVLNMIAIVFSALARNNICSYPSNQLWVADITFGATWAGFIYVAFLPLFTDVFARYIIG